jgi:hypothetical protein
MYMVSGLSDSVKQWIHRSPFGPVESGGEAGPGGRKSAAGGGGVKTGRIRLVIGRLS